MNWIKKIAHEKQNCENKRQLAELKVGDPVVVQNRTSKRWDKYGVVQEVNESGDIRMSSGLVTVHNRRDLKKRFPPKTVPKSGTSKWNPFSCLEEAQYADHESEKTDSDDSDDTNDYEGCVGQDIVNEPTRVPVVEQSPRRHVRFDTKNVQRRSSTRATKSKSPVYMNDYVVGNK